MTRLPVVDQKQCGPDKISALPAEDGTLRAGSDFAGNVCIVTLGCSKNTVDSEVMLGALRARGFRPISEPENAELIVVNTCAFLQSAVEEGLDTILQLSKLKASGRCRQLVVAGCMVERYREQLKREIPEVDRFISTDELLKVADVGATSEECFDNARRPYFIYDETMPRIRSTGSASAYVKISEGCNRRCTFCIIPKIRGDLRSRSIESIGREVRQLLDDGVREMNFVAQDLTAYGTDFEGNRGIKPELASLLRHLETVTTDTQPFWMRLFYAYPIGTTEELIREISRLPFVANYLDMPLQHVSHDVLKRMNRPLGEKNTRALVEKIREVGPEVALRTTFIAGFPGETEADVRSLEEFISAGHFAHVGVFAYSDEEEAASFAYDGRVEPEEREERRARLMTAQQAVVAKRLQTFEGRRVRVLLEGAHADTDLLMVGRTEWQGPETDGEVIINEFEESLGGADQLRGRFGEVEITEVAGYDLVGRLVEVEKS